MKIATCTLVLLLVCWSSLPAAEFFDLDTSVVTAVSADGSTAVGGNANNVAFRWTEESGLIELGTPPGLVSSWASGVSADGMVVVGSSSGVGIGWQPIRRILVWTAISTTNPVQS